MSKQFNEAFRKALRPDREPREEPPPPPGPSQPESIDGGAGSQGTRTEQKPSMNDLIRRAARDRP
jgi:hypothetical protein